MKRHFVLFTCLGILSLTLTGCGAGGGSTEPPVEPPTHEHTWADPTYTWSNDYSSCTAERVCTLDSTHKETETVNSTYIVVTESSCEADGLGRYTVSFKNSVFLTQTHDIVIEAFGHDYQFDSFVWEGFTAQAKYVCSHDSSHIEYYDAIVTSKVTTSPTCENSGIKTYTATYDGHSDTKTEVLSALGHNWGTPTYTWSDDYSSCTAERVCTQDSTHKESETANSTYLVVTESSCETDGLGRYTVSFKNSAFLTQTHDTVIEAFGHDYQFDSFVWEGFTAQAKYVCSHDSSHIEYHDATVTSEVTTAPLCENSGVRTYTASYDGHSDTKTEVLSALGHNYEFDSFVWTDFTAQAKYVCSHDSSHIEYHDATVTSEVTTTPLCENSGIKTYTATYDGHSDTKTEVLSALSHNWGTPTYTWSNDYSSCTAEIVCLNDSSHKETETVNSTYTVVAEPTEESEGLGRYTATFTKTVFVTQTHDVTLDKLEPSYYGEFPILSEDGKTLTYGLYPQKNVNNPALVSVLNSLTTPESNGWYFYNNDYYAKVSATPYNSSYVFDNGTTIVSGTTYWFKCEPITWNVLSNNDGEYYILSNVLLDAHCYYNSMSSRTIDGKTVYANNYEYSDIRNWLNDDFYNSAFALDNSYIQTTTVDNSASTTNSSYNSFACSNTQDKVFLPSCQDYKNSSYGFPTSTSSTNTRYCKTTDWARARGAYYNTSSSYLYNGYYWTRSPLIDNSYGAWIVGYDGNLNRGSVYNTHNSVRPALTIKMSHGETPILSEDGKTITYGLYPQTNVNDSSLISSLNALTTPESNGWFLYNDEYYAKVSATPYGSSYKFDNGMTIVNGRTYWFKCEPITWNVLSNNDGEYYILSSVLLDAHCYYNSASSRTIDGKTIYANNYEYSDIRAWLNNDFYNSAFALGNSHIQTTTVDNSASTTNLTSNTYACNNTQDKVFLPSYNDYINSSYGFSTSTGSTNTRYCKTTDWARARGVGYSTSSSYLYNGYYWTRSPCSDYSYYAWYVNRDGLLIGSGVGNTNRSVRPALTIKIA